MFHPWRVIVLALLAAASPAHAAEPLNVWVAASSGTQEFLRAAAYAQNQWIVVGNNSTILASTDGLNWERRALTPTNLVILGIAGGPAGWVATAGTSLLRSADGQTWVTQVLPAGVSLVRVAHGDGVWAAIGSQSGEPTVFRSTNGILWEPTWAIPSLADPLHGVDGNRFSCIAYGQGQWIALSVYSDRLETRSTVYYSADGVGWHRATGAGSGSLTEAPFAHLYNAARGAEGWRAVGVGRNSGTVTLASSDGISWQIIREPPFIAINHHLAWGGGTWLRLARVGGWEIHTHFDAPPQSGWVQRTSDLAADSDYEDLTFGRDRWVIVGSNGRIYCSGFRPSLEVGATGSSAPFNGSIKGVPGARYQIQASEDLVHWEVLQGAAAVPSGGLFQDHGSPETSRRFYRAVEL